MGIFIFKISIPKFPITYQKAKKMHSVLTHIIPLQIKQIYNQEFSSKTNQQSLQPSPYDKTIQHFQKPPKKRIFSQESATYIGRVSELAAQCLLLSRQIKTRLCLYVVSFGGGRANIGIPAGF